jgi:hypothetical protein
MPLSFGIVGKAIAILIIVAFVLWLIFTYLFATEEVADDEAERIGVIESAVDARA